MSKNKNRQRPRQSAEELLPNELRGKPAKGYKNVTNTSNYYGSQWQHHQPPPVPTGPVKFAGYAWDGDPRLTGKLAIVVNSDVQEQCMFYTTLIDFEWSGWGKVVIEKNGDEEVIRVISLHLAKQKGSGGETTIEGVDLARLFAETENLPGELRMWIHSHHKMSAFWSPTDINNIREQSSQGWVGAIVYNQKGEARGAVAFGGQGRPAWMNEDVPIRVETLIPKEKAIAWHEEFMKHVEYGHSNVQGNQFTKPAEPTVSTKTEPRRTFADTAHNRSLAKKQEFNNAQELSELVDQFENDVLKEALALGHTPDSASMYANLARELAETHGSASQDFSKGAFTFSNIRETVMNRISQSLSDIAADSD